MSDPHNPPEAADYPVPAEADDQRGAVAYQVTDEGGVPEVDYLTEEEIAAMTRATDG